MADLRRTAEYVWLVDWDGAGDGAFDGTYDDVTDDWLVDGSGATISGQGRDQARGTAPPQDSTFQGELNNQSRRYSRENGSSPLSTLIRQGRDTAIRANVGGDWLMDSPDVLMDDPLAWMDGATVSFDLFRGELSSIAEDPMIGAQRVTIRAKGRLGRLRGFSVYTQLYTDITTGAAMQHLLEAAGLVSGTDFTISSDMLTNGRILAYWYGDGRDVFTQAYELWATEGYSAFLGEDEDGLIVVLGRNDRTLAAASQEAQASFYGQPVGDQLWFSGFRIDPDSYEADIINRPYVEIEPRAAASLGVVWEYDTVITLDGTGEAFVDAKPSEPFTGAVAPVVITDFTLSAGSISVAISRTSGLLTRISFSGGTPGATISALQLRAQLLEKTGQARADTLVDTSESIATYGERALKLDAWPGLAIADAVSLCDAMAIAYQEPRPIIEADIENGNGPLLLQILDRQIGDRVYIEESHSGVAFDALIEQKAHRILPGNHHVATWGLEKVVEADWALYDVDLYGVGTFGQ